MTTTQDKFHVQPILRRCIATLKLFAPASSAARIRIKEIEQYLAELESL